MYLISVYFDNASSARLQSLIEQIAKASGNHYMTEKQVPPHLTLSAIEARSADILMPAVKQLQGRLGQGTIQFVTVGQLFPYVLYTMPVLNPYLQELALQVNHAVWDIPDTTVSKYYRPQSWLPHVTLGKTLSKEQMRQAFSVVQDRFSVFEAQVTELGLAKVNPHDDVLRFPLLRN
ncbi:MAG: 2'-5' RNA ligase family protein [Lachnospiraceae bacterium]|nr:2'-5' RNA ligase family protein [Lachnospiraceae bacterium]